MDGHGTLIYPGIKSRDIYLDGRKYDGQFKNDKKHGYGKYFWIDGRIYVG